MSPPARQGASANIVSSVGRAKARPAPCPRAQPGRPNVAATAPARLEAQSGPCDTLRSKLPDSESLTLNPG
jgi:hypothetical protein